MLTTCLLTSIFDCFVVNLVFMDHVLCTVCPSLKLFLSTWNSFALFSVLLWLRHNWSASLDSSLVSDFLSSTYESRRLQWIFLMYSANQSAYSSINNYHKHFDRDDNSWVILNVSWWDQIADAKRTAEEKLREGRFKASAGGGHIFLWVNCADPIGTKKGWLEWQMDVPITQITSQLLKKLGFGFLPHSLSHYVRLHHRWLLSLTLTPLRSNFTGWNKPNCLTLIKNNFFVMMWNCDELVCEIIKQKWVLIDCLKRWRLTCSCRVSVCEEVPVSRLHTVHLWRRVLCWRWRVGWRQ